MLGREVNTSPDYGCDKRLASGNILKTGLLLNWTQKALRMALHVQPEQLLEV